MTEELKTLASPSGSQQEQQAPPVGRCLDDDDILAFVQGSFEGEGLERVHAHMDACDVCQCLVAEAAHALDAEPISESARPSWNAVFQPHSMVGKRYRILRLIQRGGMGEVYEAFDTALRERVALKTVTSTNSDSAQAVGCLKAEVQLARRISHPNVCRIYDLGTHVMEPSGSEVNFLVMEFVEGECLGKRLRESGALPIELAHSIAHQLLLGLRAAHQAGILHRDLKSDNVMLRQESGGRVTPVILDFGLAKALNENGDMAATQSNAHAMVGTIGYMAPEQIEGDPLSTATDLYAFGVVWFEMLTGRLPFERETPVASAMARLCRPPTVPSSLNPQVPSWLDDIILQCLSRQRSDRFAFAQQVLDLLSSRVASASMAPSVSVSPSSGQSPVSVSPSSAQSPALVSTPPSSRLRSPLTVAVLAVVAIVAVSGAVTMRRQPEPRVHIPSATPVPSSQPEVEARLAPSEAGTLPSPPSSASARPQPVVADEPNPEVVKPKARLAKLQPPKAPPPREGPSAMPPTDETPTASSKEKSGAEPDDKALPARKAPDWLPIWTKKSGSEPPSVVD
jgi:serine/threonine protein kinase